MVVDVHTYLYLWYISSQRCQRCYNISFFMITPIIPAAYTGGSLTTLPRGPHPGPRHAVPLGGPAKL